jgi:hypothetical protein
MGSDGGSDHDTLLDAIRRARRQLPAEHRSLLEQIGVQEVIIDDWPRAVQDLYRTLLEPPPAAEELTGAAAVWLDSRRTVAFNGPLLRQATAGLGSQPQCAAIAALAWHEYGHALSATRASAERKRDGLRLLGLLPSGLRDAIAYPGGYRAIQVFDEVIATVYAVMVDRVRANDYGPPNWLHTDVYEAFQEVIPWPPTR